MGKEDKKSIISEAIDDYKEIQEAAEANARKKLADEFPDKFNNLLKEELNNNKKNNSDQKPYKKVEEDEKSEKLNESEDKKDDSEMKKNEKEKKETKKVVNEERDKEFTGDVENDTPNLEKGKSDGGDSYTEKPTTKKESNVNKTSTKESKESKEVNEEFDVTDLDVEDGANAIDSAEEEDDITLKSIEEEISKMEQIKEESDKKQKKESDPYNEMISMRDKLNEMISDIDEQKNQGGKQNYKGRENGGPTTQMIDEDETEVDEQKNQGGKQNYKGRENGGPTNSMIDEDDEIISDEDIDAVVDDSELEEAMGMAHSSSKHVAGDHLPGKDFANHRHKRYGSVNNSKNESTNKKVTSLLEQNKKLTKRINESKKYKETADKLLENYKKAVEKYRTQLKEMAVFNSNLAHVNNLLVNESLALTQDDKINIINDFKNAKSINESKEKYDKILSEMKGSKKTIKEDVENKLHDKTIGTSSKGKMNEVSEKTVYQNDEHLSKIRNLMEFMDKKDKKII